MYFLVHFFHSTQEHSVISTLEVTFVLCLPFDFPWSAVCLFPNSSETPSLTPPESIFELWLMWASMWPSAGRPSALRVHHPLPVPLAVPLLPQTDPVLRPASSISAGHFSPSWSRSWTPAPAVRAELARTKSVQTSQEQWLFSKQVLLTG